MQQALTAEVTLRMLTLQASAHSSLSCPPRAGAGALPLASRISVPGSRWSRAHAPKPRGTRSQDICLPVTVYNTRTQKLSLLPASRHTHLYTDRTSHRCRIAADADRRGPAAQGAQPRAALRTYMYLETAIGAYPASAQRARARAQRSPQRARPLSARD